jgi:hypothetical protein
MAARIRVLQLAITVVNVTILALAFTSIWPFPSGDFRVDLPSADEVEWSYAAGTVTVSAPYTIDNGGFYDVADLVLSYEVTNYTNALIHESTLSIGDIPSGSVRADIIEFDIPLQQMYESGDTSMVFNDDWLNFRVEVSCFYTMRLIKFDAAYQVAVPWEALIEEMAIDAVRYAGGQITVDYRVTTSELLSGTATLEIAVYQGSTLVDQQYDTIGLGTTSLGTVVLSGASAPGTYTVVLRADIYGFLAEHRESYPLGVVA